MTVRPTVSDVTVSFGLVSFPVDLLPATKSKQSKAKTASTVLLCPTCDADSRIEPVRQQYACEHDGAHGPFGKADTVSALMLDGEIVRPSGEDLSAAKKPATVRDLIELTVHPSAQVEAHTFTSGNIYRLRPRDNEAHYALLVELARDRDVAFVCEVTNKGATSLYRLIERDGALVLTELVRPDRIHEAEPLGDLTFDPKLLALGESLVSSLKEAFDPTAYVDHRRARLEALARNAEVLEPAADSSVADTASDLLELLQRSVDAAA
jgi:non-homologous end joining protein Ku